MSKTRNVASEASQIKFEIDPNSPADFIDNSPVVLLSPDEFFHELRKQNTDIELQRFINICEPKTKLFFRHFKEKTKSGDPLVDLVVSEAEILCRVERIKEIRCHQAFAVIATLCNNGQQGLLLQIGTGEGKSIISRLLSACVAKFFKKKVDLVTSSANLATREAQESKPYYSNSGLKGETNIKYWESCLNKDDFDNNNIYATSDILVSTSYDMTCDFLRNQLNLWKYAPPSSEESLQSLKDRYYVDCREGSYLIIDEVDHLFVDEKFTGCRLTSKRENIIGFDLLAMQLWSLTQSCFNENSPDFETFKEIIIKKTEETKCYQNLAQLKKRNGKWRRR